MPDPLGLSVGEFYSRLVTGMLTKGTLGDGPGTPEGRPRPVPTFAALRPWLDKIKDPALACLTAQRVAAGMARRVESSQVVERIFFYFFILCVCVCLGGHGTASVDVPAGCKVSLSLSYLV